MKKNLILGLSMLVLVPFVTNAKGCENYTNEEYNYIIEQSDPNDLDLSCKNGTLYTDDYLKSIEDKASYKNDNGISPQYYTDQTVKLAIPSYKQEKSYWCGPANIKQVLQFINGTSKSQSEYAKETKTEENGSAYVYLVRNVLNKYTKSGYYSYVLGTNYDETGFRALVKENVHANKPIILHAKTGSLEKYNGNDFGHYLTVGGLSETDHPLIPKSIVYFDTYSNNFGKGNTFGEQKVDLSDVFGTINISGRYIIK